MLIKILSKILGYILSFFYRILYLSNAKYNPLKVILNCSLTIAKGKLICLGNFQTRFGCIININRGIVIIGKNASLSSFCSINCHEYIEIGENTIIAEGVKIFDHDHQVVEGVVQRKKFVSKAIRIGKNVWIGTNVVILKGAHIGDNCIISAGSIVTKSVPPNCILLQKRESTIEVIKPAVNQ